MIRCLIDRQCQRRGLLVRPLINMCVLSPPLTISHAQIDEIVEILRAGILAAMDELESLSGNSQAGAAGTEPAHHPAPAG